MFREMTLDEILELSQRPDKLKVIVDEMCQVTRRPIAIGYIRVSTYRQVESGLGLEAQKQGITKYFDRVLSETHDWHGFYLDPGKSAYKLPFLNREAGLKASEAVNNGDSIIFHKADRAFRSVEDQVVNFSKWRERGVTIHSASEGWTTADYMGRLHANLMALFAEQESERKAERQRETQAVARQDGRIVAGQPSVGFKYSRSRPVRLIAHEGDRAIMPKLVEWRDKGHTYRDIETHLQFLGVKHDKRRNGKRQFWSFMRVRSGYYMQLFLNFVAAEGRTVDNDLQVRRVLRAWASGSLKSEAFRLQLDKWHAENRNG
jgi:DNA invertase Pin-like site-specific DNA recombinase